MSWGRSLLCITGVGGRVVLIALEVGGGSWEVGAVGGCGVTDVAGSGTGITFSSSGSRSKKLA